MKYYKREDVTKILYFRNKVGKGFISVEKFLKSYHYQGITPLDCTEKKSKIEYDNIVK